MIVIRSINGSRVQSVASAFIQIEGQAFLINVPEGSQRFAAAGGVRLGIGSLLCATRGGAGVLGLPGTLLSLADRGGAEGVRVVLPIEGLDLMQSLAPMMGPKFNEFAYLGLGSGRVRRELFGLPRGLREEFKNSHLSEEFQAAAVAAAPELQEKLARVRSGPSAFFAPAELEAWGVEALGGPGWEMLAVPMGGLESSRLAYVFLAKGKPGRLDPARLAGLSLTPSEFRTLSSGGLVERNGVQLSRTDLEAPPISVAVAAADLSSPAEAVGFARHPLLRAVAGHPGVSLKLLLHLGEPAAVPEEVGAELAALTSGGVAQVFLHPSSDARPANESPSSRYAAFSSALAENFPFFFPRLKRDLPPLPLPSWSLPHSSYREIKVSDSKLACAPLDSETSNSQRSAKLVENISLAGANDPQVSLHRAQNPLISYLNSLPKQRDPNAAPSVHFLEDPYRVPFVPFCCALGTGSMVPAQLRNVSAYLVGFSPSYFLLFDCGEGTLFQIQEQFGPKTDEVLAAVRVVTLSHVHGDHTLGLFAFLEERRAALGRLGRLKPSTPLPAEDQSEIFVVCPENCVSMVLRAACPGTKIVCASSLIPELPMSEWPQASYRHRYFSPSALSALSAWRERGGEVEGLKGLHSFLCSEGATLLPVPVDHCPEAVAWVVESKGRKVVFSGDCRPSPQLALAGRGADLLIHEATFDCSHSPIEVRAKGHTSITDAVGVAGEMRAKRVLLTHFSQRLGQWTGDGESQVAVLKDQEFIEFYRNRCFLATDHLVFPLEFPPEILAASKGINGGFRLVGCDRPVDQPGNGDGEVEED